MNVFAPGTPVEPLLQKTRRRERERERMSRFSVSRAVDVGESREERGHVTVKEHKATELKCR